MVHLLLFLDPAELVVNFLLIVKHLLLLMGPQKGNQSLWFGGAEFRQLQARLGLGELLLG